MAYRPLLDRLQPAHAAAIEHVLPVGAGLVVGVLAGFVLPSTTRSQDFFAVAAQVIPVLLLALAIEARVFGGLTRQRSGDAFVRGLGIVRLALSMALLVMFLWAELHAVEALGKGSGQRASWPENVALAWGTMTVGAIALAGLGRPRLRATLKWRQHHENVVIEAAASNEFGDKDIAPLMNLLIPAGPAIFRCDAYGNPDTSAKLQLLVTDQEEYAGVGLWNYVSERPLITAGDATLRHFLVRGFRPGRSYPLVLRYDHAELPAGRVEVMKSICTDEESPTSG